MSRVSAEVAALRQAELFKGLSDKDLVRIAAVAKAIEFEVGAAITTEGDTDGRFFVILEGKARVEVGGKAEDTLGSGDYFGEIALIDAEPRSATIVAETPVKTLSLARWNFRPLLMEEPTIAEHVLIEMCRRLRLARENRLS